MSTGTLSRRTKSPPRSQPATVRCAIYTRKSTEEGLEQEFNSLDAQREAAQAYIQSQAGEGWVAVPEAYDDGGYSGGNTDRPALQRLLADIQAGRIDVVLVYKVDRLSRSLLDFGRLMELFEQHRVAFVAVTQQINSSSSMGRLMLNVLLSFAQFEREIISERTRDKIAAARRKGKWSGGQPVLGYDLDPQGGKLVVNPAEAERVRQIFELYRDRRSITDVLQELDRRGWHSKAWVTKKGQSRGGEPFDKARLHRLLTNVVYHGQLRYKDEVHAGEQQAIIRPELWNAVQALLQQNGRTGGSEVRNQFGALLKGLLRCKSCGCAMTPSHATRNGKVRYRYYVCGRAQKRGWHHCPAPSIPAPPIEEFVVQQIRRIGQDPVLRDATLAELQRQTAEHQQTLERELRLVEKDLFRWGAEIRDLAIQAGAYEPGSPGLARLADLQERVRLGTQRHRDLAEQQQRTLGNAEVSQEELSAALAQFDPVWDQLTLREQTRVIGLLIETVEYDGEHEKVLIRFRPLGLAEFSQQVRQRTGVA